MSTPATPAAANTPPRQITQSEVQRFLLDAWEGCQMRLAPGRLANHSFSRVDQHAAEHYTDILRAAKKQIFLDYQKAVETQADAYYKSVRDLMFEPQTSTQKTFRPLALTWLVEHPAVAKRERLTLQNQGLGAVEKEWSVEEVNERDAKATAQAANEKREERAKKDIEVELSRICFQNMHGFDQRQTDDLRVELRGYIRQHEGKKSWFDIWGYVNARIANAYKQHERDQERWNSR
jgi:hypothetical protein